MAHLKKWVFAFSYGITRRVGFPLFRWKVPTEDDIRRFISEQSDSKFSYSEVGASGSGVPAGYNIDHNRVQLGTGEAVWQRGVQAIRAWRMFNLTWLRLYWPTTPIQVGTDVAICVSHFGFYSLNACRIVYVIDEDGPVKRFGFAYGTLEEHAESGEERFTVEWNHAEDEVWYDILAFSRPKMIFAKLGYPFSRLLQSNFVRDSKAAMVQAIRATELGGKS